MSISTGDRYPPLNLSPQRQKELTLQALVAQIVSIAARSPVLFVLEDAHWIDPMTLELMDLTVEQAVDAAVLVLITYRPEFDAPWMGRARVSPVHLGRLELRDCAILVQRVASQGDLPDTLRDQIADQTDGVPLFVEELTKSVMETAFGPEGPSATIEIPATLQDSLEARLDRLGSAKEIAQIGAVIGRGFSFDLLAHVSDLADADLRAALDRLVQSELVFRRGEPPDATYTFKHALIQDTAYGSLLRSQRSDLHGIIASVLDQKFPQTTSAQPVLLAHHFASAGRAEEAIEYYFRAGQNASQRWSSAEAVQHLQDGLSLLEAVDDEDQRSRLELRLQMALGPAMMSIKGWGSSEAKEPYDRASELSSRIGDGREHFTALWGLWMIHEQRRERARAEEITDTLMALAERENDTGLKVQAHHAAWGNQWRGNFSQQISHIEDGLELYDPALHGSQAAQFGGHDAGVCGLSLGANVLWALGYPEQSLTFCGRARSLADEIGDLPSIAHSWLFSGWIQSHAGHWDEALRCAEQCMAIGKEQALPRWVLQALPVRGMALAMQGNIEQGLADIRHALDVFQSQATLGVATCHVFLTQAHALRGPPEEGIELADEAISLVEQLEERAQRQTSTVSRASYY